MMKGFQQKACPQCGAPKTKEWKDLTDEEKFLAERLPMSATFTRREREKHLFCTRCWQEVVPDETADC